MFTELKQTTPFSPHTVQHHEPPLAGWDQPVPEWFDEREPFLELIDAETGEPIVSFFSPEPA